MSATRPSAGIRVAISIALLAGLVIWAGSERLLATFTAADPVLLLASVAVSYVALAIGAFDVIVLTHALLPDMRVVAAVRAYLRSWAVGMIAPGKVGDLTYAGFLAEEGAPNLAAGLAVAVVDKVITFAITAAIAVAGLALYVGKRDALVGALVSVGAVVAALMLLRNRRLRDVVRERVMGSRARRVEGFSRDLDALLLRHRVPLAVNAFGTATRIVVAGAATLLALRAFDSDAPLAVVVMVNAIAQLATLIPISLSGLGVRQSVSAVLLARISGVARGAVVGEQLLATVVAYATVAAVFAMLGGRVTEQD